MNNTKFNVKRLEKISDDLVNKSIQLLNSTGGNGQIRFDDLKRMLPHPQCFVAGAFLEDELIGISLAFIMRPEAINYYNQFSSSFEETYGTYKLGQMHSVAVEPKLQGQGVGSLLLAIRLEWLKREACDYAVAVSWDNGQPNSSKHLFTKFQFEKIKEIPGFYQKNLRKESKQCIFCGDTCNCKAILFIKNCF